jgi:hypothetical protein
MTICFFLTVQIVFLALAIFPELPNLVILFNDLIFFNSYYILDTGNIVIVNGDNLPELPITNAMDLPTPPNTPPQNEVPTNASTPNESIPSDQASNADEDKCGCGHDGSGSGCTCEHDRLKAIELRDQAESVCCICGQGGSNVSCACANCVCQGHEDCIHGTNNDNKSFNESNTTQDNNKTTQDNNKRDRENESDKDNRADNTKRTRTVK